MKNLLSRKNLIIPYGLFLALFVVIPLLFIVYYAFTDKSGAFTLGNFADFFANQTSISTLILSFGIGALNTVICLIIAYPIAFILANSKLNKNATLVMLFVMPMWINFVLRAYATRELLSFLGLFQYNFLSTMIGMVYDFLPFMIMPIYTVMLKMDKSVIEAAYDLGASPARVMTRVIFPLSLPGIVSGATMVFMPTMTCYVICDMLGSGKVTILGHLISGRFLGSDLNWQVGSAISLILLIIMGVSMLIFSRFGEKDDGMRGAALW